MVRAFIGSGAGVAVGVTVSAGAAVGGIACTGWQPVNNALASTAANAPSRFAEGLIYPVHMSKVNNIASTPINRMLTIVQTLSKAGLRPRWLSQRKTGGAARM